MCMMYKKYPSISTASCQCPIHTLSPIAYAENLPVEDQASSHRAKSKSSHIQALDFTVRNTNASPLCNMPNSPVPQPLTSALISHH